MSIADFFLENRPESSPFVVGLVTENEAPSYYCAVPVRMCFNRILARLDINEMNGQCYYRSVGSMLTDVHTILDNCTMYSSPDSPLVTVCSFLIPASVSVKHEEEQQNAETI